MDHLAVSRWLGSGPRPKRASLRAVSRGGDLFRAADLPNPSRPLKEGCGLCHSTNCAAPKPRWREKHMAASEGSHDLPNLAVSRPHAQELEPQPKEGCDPSRPQVQELEPQLKEGCGLCHSTNCATPKPRWCERHAATGKRSHDLPNLRDVSEDDGDAPPANAARKRIGAPPPGVSPTQEGGRYVHKQEHRRVHEDVHGHVQGMRADMCTEMCTGSSCSDSSAQLQLAERGYLRACRRRKPRGPTDLKVPETRLIETSLTLP